MAGWTLLAVGFAASRGEGPTPRWFLSLPFVATALLAIVLLARLGASPDAAYGSVKVRLFLLVNVVALIAGMAVGRTTRSFRLYVVVALVLGTFTALELARGLATGSARTGVGGRVSLDQHVNPIGLGREAATAIMIAVALVLVVRSPFMRLFALGALPLIAVAFLATGSRGPLLGLLFGLVLLFAVALRTRESKRRVVLVAVAAIVGAVLVTQLVPGQNLNRALSVLSGGTGGDATNGRSQLWATAENAFRAHPLAGIGTGGFAAVRPVDLYPHNIFLEVSSELGFAGLLPLLALIAAGVAALVRSYRRTPERERGDVALVAAFFGAALVNAQFSADVTGNEALWLATGLAYGLAARHGAGIPVLEPIVWMRARRREAVRRREGAKGAESERPAWSGRRGGGSVPAAPFPGDIVVPAEGDAVGGLVPVSGRPARTGWGVVRVSLELSGDGERWNEVAQRTGDSFDVVGVSGGFREHLAVLRSRRLAELLVAQLGRLPSGRRFEIEPSQRRPWDPGTGWSSEWDARELADGEYMLRAVTTDVAGTRVASPVRRVRVDASAAAAPARLAAPVESLERPLADLEAERQLLTHELARRLAAVATAEAKLAAREAGLGRRVEVVAGQERALARARAELAASEAALDAREARFAMRETTLEEPLRGLDEPERPAEPEQPPAAAPPAPVAPVPAPPAAVPPAVAATTDSGDDVFRLWTLEKLVAERPDPDVFVQEEREAVLFAIREHAEVDGTIPHGFHAMLRDVLGELLD